MSPPWLRWSSILGVPSASDSTSEKWAAAFHPACGRAVAAAATTRAKAAISRARVTRASLGGTYDRAVTDVRVERFGPALLDDFHRLHSDANGAGWCRCVAWWVPSWDGWGERPAAENAALREELCNAGEYDGLLAFAGDEPVGWCQLGRRDRLEKLVLQLELDRRRRRGR